MEAKTSDEIVASAEWFAKHDPAVEWPEGPHDNPVAAIMAALDKIRETRPTPEPDHDHARLAANYLRRADEIVNLDGHVTAREELFDHFMRFANAHALLAIAQQIAMVPS